MSRRFKGFARSATTRLNAETTTSRSSSTFIDISSLEWTDESRILARRSFCKSYRHRLPVSVGQPPIATAEASKNVVLTDGRSRMACIGAVRAGVLGLDRGPDKQRQNSMPSWNSGPRCTGLCDSRRVIPPNRPSDGSVPPYSCISARPRVDVPRIDPAESRMRRAEVTHLTSGSLGLTRAVSKPAVSLR